MKKLILNYPEDTIVFCEETMSQIEDMVKSDTPLTGIPLTEEELKFRKSRYALSPGT